MTIKKANVLSAILIGTPKYKPGDEVYLVDHKKGKVSKTTIRCIPLDYFILENKAYLKFIGFYELNSFTFPGNFLPPTWCREEYIYLTESEAELMGKFWSVELTDEQWLACIGERFIGDGPGNIHDGCELTSGSVNDNTSNIRDVLLDTKDNKGIVEVDRLHLQHLIDNCYNYPEALDDEHSLLSKLLVSLELNWKQK